MQYHKMKAYIYVSVGILSVILLFIYNVCLIEGLQTIDYLYFTNFDLCKQKQRKLKAVNASEVYGVTI